MRAWANSGRPGRQRVCNKVGVAPLVLLRQWGPARPDAEWKLVVGKQFFRCGCRFRTFGMTIAIECFSRSAQPDCSTADTGPHRARESMLSIIIRGRSRHALQATFHGPRDGGIASARGSRGRPRRPFGWRRGPIHRCRSRRSAGSGIARNMPGIPRSPREDRKGENDCNTDDRQRSAVDRAVPVLSIPHAALLSDYQGTPLST
jgi:hypothetical protein